MPMIEVDDEVFKFLQQHAIPLVDTPNSTLRRLLLGKSEETMSKVPSTSVKALSPASLAAGTDEFIARILGHLFPNEHFGKRQMLFESENCTLYFNNFNKRGTATLWYRLSGGNWKSARTTRKESYVILTNPSEGLVFKIPVSEILKAANARGRHLDAIEVNISLADMRWKELGIDLKGYHVQLP